MKKSDQDKPVAKSGAGATAKKISTSTASRQKATSSEKAPKPAKPKTPAKSAPKTAAKSPAKPRKKAAKSTKATKAVKTTAGAKKESTSPIDTAAMAQPTAVPGPSSADGTPVAPVELPATPQPTPTNIPPQTAVPASPFSRTVEIKITMPAIPVPRRVRVGVVAVTHTTTAVMLADLMKTMPRRRLWLNALVCLAIVLLLGNTHFFSAKAPTASGAAVERPKLQRGAPAYSTILPAGKSIDSLGGWTRISPPDRDPVYTYLDKIGTTQINVSEQPLPKGFKADPNQSISQLAQNFNATQKVTAGTITVYIGTSEQGAQSVILTKNDLLILIKSAYTLTANDWVAYVNSLN